MNLERLQASYVGNSLEVGVKETFSLSSVYREGKCPCLYFVREMYEYMLIFLQS
jgi:hypothetical protein